MRNLITLIVGLTVGLVASTAMAQGQLQCNERDSFLAVLDQKYQETIVGMGVTNTGGLVELLTNPKGATWTIIVTTPQGMSCLVAAGEGWRNMEQIALDPEV